MGDEPQRRVRYQCGASLRTELRLHSKLGYVTRARVTQIMNLALLAPDLQEELLFATEGTVLFRQIIALVDWDDAALTLERAPDNPRSQKPIMSPESGTRRATKIP